MYAAYTDWLADHAAGISWEGQTVRAVLLVESSGFTTEGGEVNDLGVASSSTLEELLLRPGWQAAASLPATTTVSESGTAVSLDGDCEFVSSPIYLEAVAITLVGEFDGTVDPLLVVYRNVAPVLFTGSASHPGIISQSGDLATPWLFDVDGYVYPAPLQVSVPVINWESAHAVHVWMAPNRINYVANPSFESLGNGDLLFGWRSNGSLDRVEGGVGPAPRSKCAHLSGSAETKVLESNFFPATNERGFWSVEVAVSAPGTYRFGLLYWDSGMDPDDCYFSYKEETVYAPGSETGPFQRLTAVFTMPEEMWKVQFRLEFDGEECWADNVLAEPTESQAGYFDGEWELGQPGDFGWYNLERNPSSVHRSYSTYYPERSKIGRYLFGYWKSQAPGDNPVESRGAAFRHVPENNQVVAHWDDINYFRIHSWTQDVKTPVVDFPAVVKNQVVDLS